MFQTYMTAGQMLIYQKDMLALGELTEVKNIRHECDFMMRDFRKRIASMFFPAFEAGIGHCLLNSHGTRWQCTAKTFYYGVFDAYRLNWHELCISSAQEIRFVV